MAPTATARRAVTNPNTVEELFALYAEKGDEHYGESITQTEHALQCAALARRDGASDALIVAALFHDVGHLVADVKDDADFDDRRGRRRPRGPRRADPRAHLRTRRRADRSRCTSRPSAGAAPATRLPRATFAGVSGDPEGPGRTAERRGVRPLRGAPRLRRRAGPANLGRPGQGRGPRRRRAVATRSRWSARWPRTR